MSKSLLGSRSSFRVWPREAFANIDEIDAPTKLSELSDDAAIVGVASRRGGKIAWYVNAIRLTTRVPRTRHVQHAIRTA